MSEEKPRKEPQDHLSKVEKPKVTKTEDGYTVVHGGVTLTITVDALDDFELLRDLAKMQDDAVADTVRLSMIPGVFTRFFGEKQSPVVLNALRDPKTKRVKLGDASTYLFDVIRALNPEL